MRIATRGSALALWQARRVAELLAAAGHPSELIIVETTGDRRVDVPISELGGQGVFVKEVEQALLDHRADVAVHSAKDLPSTMADGLVLAAVLERADPRDALVGSTLAGLADGARVATGSPRRRAQLLLARPDLELFDLRGNIPTRLERAAGYDAVVVACAALDRLGRSDAATERLDPATMLPQVGQGAVAVQCRAGDVPALAATAPLDDPDTRRCVEAERAFLATLGGGCDLPVGAYATPAGAGLDIAAFLARVDGRRVAAVRASEQGALGPPADVGHRLAQELLDRRGGRALLEPAG